MGTICHNMIFLINLVIFQTLVFQNNKEMLMQLLLEVHKTLMFSKILLKTPTGLVEFLLNRKVHMIYQKMLKIFQILTIIINKEMFFQLVISTIHKVKLILKMLPCNPEIAIGIQLCLVNNNIIYLKMLKIFQILTTIINKETYCQLDTNTTHKVKLTFKITICNQEMENTLLCLVNKRTPMIYQKMLKIFQILTTIINREMFFPPVISTIHKVKLILRMLPCSQEITIGIQLCLMKKKTKRVISISIIINTITRILKMIKKFKLVLNLKKLMLH
jgi:hypothetical protein